MIVKPEDSVMCGSCDRVVMKSASESDASIENPSFVYCNNCYDIIAISVCDDGNYDISTIDGDEM